MARMTIIVAGSGHCGNRYVLATIPAMNDENDLSEVIVKPALSTVWFGRPYVYAASLDSTNEQMKAWVADPAYPSGAVLLADFQSAGRGRLDRRWDAPPGTALLFSVLLRPRWPVNQGAWLTMLAGLAVAEAIEAVAGLPARLKWPNDVVLAVGETGEWHKVCGLLLDVTLAPAGDRLESAIIGIGLNVNIPESGLPVAATPATSLLVAGGRPVARRALLLALLERLEQYYEAAVVGRSPAEGWATRLITLGRPVVVTSPGSSSSPAGTAEGVDEWGQLLVRDASGVLHTVAAGDVTLRGR